MRTLHHKTLQIGLFVSTILTLLVFSMTACSDPGMIFKERKDIRVDDHESDRPTLCTAPVNGDDLTIETVVCGT